MHIKGRGKWEGDRQREILRERGRTWGIDNDRNKDRQTYDTGFCYSVIAKTAGTNISQIYVLDL